MLNSTPEQYFREKQEDFFEFKYCGPANKQAIDKHRNVLKAWLERLFPALQVTRLGPSEYSGWMCGGPSASTTSADESVRQAFLEEWAFKNSPWKLVEHRYADWLSALQNCQIVPAPLQERRRVRYWQLPEGALLLSQNTSGKLLSSGDAQWWFAHEMPNHRADARSEVVSGEYFYHPPRDGDKATHLATVDWGEFEELQAAKALERNPVFTAWLRETLAIPDGEVLEITMEP